MNRGIHLKLAAKLSNVWGPPLIKRFTSSRPIALAFADGLIASDLTVFDYGCGHGADVLYLKKRKINASGWDPAHDPKSKIQEADVVNLGYVLNVIEDPAERQETLRKAYALARQVLVVSVRVDRTIGETIAFSDGLLTTKGTFQKLYTQDEFREYVESALNRRIHFAGLGIAYVFVDDEAESAYIAGAAFAKRLDYRTELIESFSKDAVAKRLVKKTSELGRLPLPEEFPGYRKLQDRFGSPQRIQRLVMRQIDPKAYDGSQSERRNDILTYYSMIRLQGLKPPPALSLPGNIYADIKAIWKDYKSAQAEADQFLFSIGNVDTVSSVCQSAGMGKLVNDHLYLHRSVEDELPPLLRLIIFAGRRIVGDVGYNLIKLWLDGRKVAFVLYDDFDKDPHPTLQYSVMAYLPRSDYGIRNYTESTNPPILHRKETFVLDSYPYYDKFRKLTNQEEQLGLLSRSDIGHKEGWEALLTEKKVSIKNHKVLGFRKLKAVATA